MDVWLLLLALLFVFANGFFVAAEFAIVKVRSTQIVELAEQGSARAKMAKKLIRHLDAYSPRHSSASRSRLSRSAGSASRFHHLIQPLFSYYGISEKAATTIAATIAFAIISVLHIVLGELAPKSIAIQKPVATTLWTSHVLHSFYVVTYPAIWLLNGTSRALLRLIGIEPAGEHAETAHSPEELRLILASSEKAGILSKRTARSSKASFNSRNVPRGRSWCRARTSCSSRRRARSRRTSRRSARRATRGIRCAKEVSTTRSASFT
jgi:CBS domain containing-hemolysin-like protein